MKGGFPTPLRVALYTRVSKRDQEAKNQLPQLRQFARKQGWKVTREFNDVASGAYVTAILCIKTGS